MNGKRIWSDNGYKTPNDLIEYINKGANEADLI